MTSEYDDPRAEALRTDDPIHSIDRCPECNERCIKLQLPVFSGDPRPTAVTWCVNGHVCVVDPLIGVNYRLVHNFREYDE